MVQVGQQAKPQMPNQQKPMAQPTQNTQVMQEPMKKKSKWWLWVIIALAVLIGVGAAVYFIFVK